MEQQSNHVLKTRLSTVAYCNTLDIINPHENIFTRLRLDIKAAQNDMILLYRTG